MLANQWITSSVNSCSNIWDKASVKTTYLLFPFSLAFVSWGFCFYQMLYKIISLLLHLTLFLGIRIHFRRMASCFECSDWQFGNPPPPPPSPSCQLWPRSVESALTTIRGRLCGLNLCGLSVFIFSLESATHVILVILVSLAFTSW